MLEWHTIKSEKTGKKQKQRFSLIFSLCFLYDFVCVCLFMPSMHHFMLQSLCFLLDSVLSKVFTSSCQRAYSTMVRHPCVFTIHKSHCSPCGTGQISVKFIQRLPNDHICCFLGNNLWTAMDCKLYELLHYWHFDFLLVSRRWYKRKTKPPYINRIP